MSNIKIESDDFMDKLKKSRLTPGVFAPNESDLTDKTHTVIYFKEEPVLSLGLNDDESMRQAEMLLNDPCFLELTSLKLGTDNPSLELEIRLVDGTLLPWSVRMSCVVLGEKDHVEDGTDEGPLWWIVFGDSAHAYSAAISVAQEIERIALSGVDE